MKKIIAFILTLIPLCTISAQELFVCDFKHVPDDVSAAIYQVKDANGEPLNVAYQVAIFGNFWATFFQ